MSRFYEADGDNPADNLYFPNLRRAVSSARGQRVLRHVAEALLAMPQRRLIASAIKDQATGEVCAVGAVAQHDGVSLDRCGDQGWEGDQEQTIELGMSIGLGKMIAWHLGCVNDLDCPSVDQWDVDRVKSRDYNGETSVISYEDGKLTYLYRPSIVIEEFDPEERRVVGRYARDPFGTIYTRGYTPEERWQAVYDWVFSAIRWNLPTLPMTS